MLILHGVKDPLVTPLQPTSTRLVPQSELVMCGDHLRSSSTPTIEEPLTDFIQRVEAQGGDSPSRPQGGEAARLRSPHGATDGGLPHRPDRRILVARICRVATGLLIARPRGVPGTLACRVFVGRAVYLTGAGWAVILYRAPLRWFLRPGRGGSSQWFNAAA
jgi:hypothetical protein